MKKTDLIKRVSADYGVSYNLAKQWVNAIFHTLRDCVIDYKVVKIAGFGTFEHKTTKRKDIVLPTGEKIDLQQHEKLKFTPSKYLDGAIADGISSMAFDDRKEKINALLRGEDVPGYQLYGDGRLMRIDDEDDNKDVE